MRARIKFTIGLKIYLIIGLCLVALLGVAAFEMRELAAGLETQKRVELKHLAQVAMAVVKEEEAAAQSGGVSDDEARKRAALRISKLRYGENDYFWINDMHPTMVMHPTKPELNGKDLSENKDPNGKHLFVEMVDVVKRTAPAMSPTIGRSPARTGRNRNCPMSRDTRRGAGSSAPACTSTTSRPRSGRHRQAGAAHHGDHHPRWSASSRPSSGAGPRAPSAA